MSEHAHELIHDHFTTGLTEAARAEMRRHVRSCPRCEGLFERYAEAEAALSPSEAGLGIAARDRIERAVFAAPPAPGRAPIWGRLAVPALALTAALGVLLTMRPAPAPGELQPRGAHPADTAGAEARAPAGLALRALRLRGDGETVDVMDLATKDATIRAGDQIALLYVNHAGARRAQVFLRTAGEPPRALGPEIALEPGVEDARLGAPLAIDAGWPAGEARIEARFVGPEGQAWVRAVEVRRAPR